MKSRIGELSIYLNRAKARGAKLNGKSAFEKELSNLINEPEIKIELNNNKNTFEVDCEEKLSQAIKYES